MGKWFQVAWKKNTIVSGLLAVGIWGLIGALLLQSMPIPDALWAAGGGIMAYFFKAKSVNGV